MLTGHQLNIFDYLNYHEFLRDFYTLEKAADPLFSYRVFAVAVHIDASLLVKILQGKRHLSAEGIEQFISFFRFKSAKSEYFRELVAYAKARRDLDLKRHFEKLQKMRPAAKRQIDEARYRYFQMWYFPMIRSAIDVFEYYSHEQAETLGSLCHPKLSATQVIEALTHLEKLGLIQKDFSGRLIPTDVHLSTGERWQSAAVQDYQKQMVDHAKNAIDSIPREKRDISTLTLALDSSQIERIKAVLAEARTSIVKQVGAMPSKECDAVYQLNIQLFPVMQKEKELDS